jgi:hypothetical protein
MKLIKVVFEGSVEEYRSSGVASLFNGHAHVDSSGSQEGGKKEDAKEDAIEPKEAVRRMLQRLPMSDSLRELFLVLKDGPQSIDEIKAKTGWESSKLRGVIGGLGRRASGTPEVQMSGLDASSAAVLKWEQVGNSWIYSLQPYAAEALKQEGII